MATGLTVVGVVLVLITIVLGGYWREVAMNTFSRTSVGLHFYGCWCLFRSCSSASGSLQASHTLLFLLSVLAIVPLAALLSHATESVAARTGDMVGGLLNAIAGQSDGADHRARRRCAAGQYMLVKASVAGAIVTNTLFMLGASFLLGGLEASRAGVQPGAARGCRPRSCSSATVACWFRRR